MIVRLGWRLRSREPAPSAGTPPWERGLARLGHRALDVGVFAACVTGLLLSSTFRQPLDVMLFGAWPLPAIRVENPRDWHERLEGLHEVMVYALAALSALHVAAPVYHQRVRRDETMRRMLPF